MKSKKKKSRVFIASFIIVSAISIILIAYSKSPQREIWKQLQLGDRYLEQLEYKQAIAAYVAVIKIEPNNKQAWQKMGEIFLALTEHEIEPDQQTITFKLYTGGENEIWIPARINIDDVSYTVYVDSGLFSRKSRIIKKIVFQDGVSTTENASYLFGNCRVLEELDIQGLDTSRATNMEGMFSGCCSLQHLDVSNLDTHNVTNMRAMFGDAIISWNVKSSKYDFSEGVDEEILKTVWGDMDIHYKVTSNDYSWIDIENGCYSLKELDLSNFDTSNVTDMSWMFQGSSGVESLDLSSFDTSKVVDMSGMFDIGMTFPSDKLKSINISSFNTSNVEKMRCMFFGCEGLESIDVSGFDTSKVTDMGHMFHNCKSVKELDVNGFDTANVEKMDMMFAGCNELQSLDVSGFQMQKVTNMERMFEDCNKLDERYFIQFKE